MSRATIEYKNCNNGKNREDLILVDKDGLAIVPLLSSINEHAGNISLAIYCASNTLFNNIFNKNDSNGNVCKITIEGKNETLIIEDCGNYLKVSKKI
ncbi:hypothetical protein [Methanothermococcus sp.]|uniref:hypothetical protein n=1 Tax=Methanothermococcus sp. TaxID=2614238 RepID=UPI0025DC28A0|nr:hypothetical protein [Methanothermococcus sp.]